MSRSGLGPVPGALTPGAVDHPGELVVGHGFDGGQADRQAGHGRVLVTGAGGLRGSHELRDQRHRVAGGQATGFDEQADRLFRSLDLRGPAGA